MKAGYECKPFSSSVGVGTDPCDLEEIAARGSQLKISGSDF